MREVWVRIPPECNLKKLSQVLCCVVCYFVILSLPECLSIHVCVRVHDAPVTGLTWSVREGDRLNVPPYNHQGPADTFMTSWSFIHCTNQSKHLNCVSFPAPSAYIYFDLWTHFRADSKVKCVHTHVQGEDLGMRLCVASFTCTCTCTCNCRVLLTLHHPVDRYQWTLWLSRLCLVVQQTLYHPPESLIDAHLALCTVCVYMYVQYACAFRPLYKCPK